MGLFLGVALNILIYLYKKSELQLTHNPIADTPNLSEERLG